MFYEDSEVDQIYDTRDIQIRSVIAFMRGLGYFSLGSNGFFDKLPVNGNKVTFKTAIKLHNGSFELYDTKGKLKSPWNVFDKYQLNKARASRIVKNAKLQYSRKKGIICQSNIVEFVDPDYYDIFFN